MVAGIAGRTTLDAWSDVRIDYVYTEQKHSKGRCVVRVFVECEAARAGEYALSAGIGEATVTKKVWLAAGSNRPVLDVVVVSPELWWPNGHGEACLYDLSVRAGGHALTRKIGLRTLHGSHGKSVRIETLQLRQGELFVEGTTEKQR